MKHTDFLKKTGMEFKVARIRKNISRSELCKLTGLSKEAISAVELGNTDCKILTYKRISDALEIDFNSLFC